MNSPILCICFIHRLEKLQLLCIQLHGIWWIFNDLDDNMELFHAVLVQVPDDFMPLYQD